MGIVQVDSENISNIKNGILNDSRVDGGRVRRKVGVVSITTDDSPGSTYRYFRIPSDAIIVETKTARVNGFTGLSSEDIGLYDINDGAVVQVDLFADGRPITAVSVGGQTQTGRGNGFTDEQRLQQIWERLGLSADPHKEYDVVLTLNNTSAVTGTESFIMTYVND